MKSVGEELEEVLNSRCRDLDEQLNAALQLVREIRGKRHQLAKEIAERLGLNEGKQKYLGLSDNSIPLPDK